MTLRVVWFRKDLRFSDHTALAKAVEQANEGDELLLVFHIDPQWKEKLSFRHEYFLQTLESHKKQAETLGAPLHFIEGDPIEAFGGLLEAYKISRVYFNKDETGVGQERDEMVTRYLKEHGVEVYRYQDHHLHGVDEISKKSGGHYKVFTPYYKQWKTLQKPAVQRVDHAKLKQVARDERQAFSKGNEAFNHLLSQSKHGFNRAGEAEAMERLKDFVEEAIYHYDEDRDFPAIDGTSMMSKFLRTGAISIRTVYHYIHEEVDFRKNTEGVETYISELAWRDFYHMIYYYYPDSAEKEMIEKYRNLPWNYDEDLFEAWKNGQTGFPLIDAAMRQLNETGWMHNRLRMAVASFLTKDLLMDWRGGERYFAEKLIDYDKASNVGGWQWAASTGTDPVPYFRVFNPTRQSERFDPHGRFIKEWVPELADVPKKYIHNPDRLSDQEQERVGCIIGKDYPKPVVDHKTMRERAIEMFQDRK